MKLWGRLVCLALRKHRKGKLFRTDAVDETPRYKYYKCPRCSGNLTRYKV